MRVFVLSVCGAAASILIYVLLGSDLDYVRAHLALCLLFAALIFIGELRPIIIARLDRHDEITVSTTFAIALTLLGPLWIAVASLSISVALQEIRTGKSMVKLAFNVSQYVLTLAAVRLVYCLLTGVSALTPGPYQIIALPGQLGAVLAAAITFFVVNTWLIAVVSALAYGMSIAGHLRDDFRFQLATAGILAAFAPVVVAAVQVTLWLAPLLVLPIIAIHRSAKTAGEREQEALHDALTGLPNRELFRMRVARACQDGRRADSHVAVLLIDLDHFKEINDTLGHHVGDDLLCVVATRIADSLRPGDVVARLGGDEFAVLAPGLVSADDALGVGMRVLQTLEEPFEVDNVRLDVRASVGIAVFPEHGDSMEPLLRRADVAMYAAKVDRGSVQLYDAAADDHTPERLALAAELKASLERSELFLEYQPKVDVPTGGTVGFEALLRWNHPRHGRLMPDDFLPVVENTGLIGPITIVVLELALSAAAAWRAAGHEVPVSVNLSVRHLTDLSLPNQVAGLLTRYGLPAEALTLEVTETLIMNDPIRARDVLHLLRDLGVGLAIDDYGSGYSSLAYLRRLEVDELKIDKSFLLNVAVDQGNATIVRSTIELGHNLGLRIVAEGVETHAALELLRSWRCDQAQGFLFSRPLPSDAVLPWLVAHTAIPAQAQRC